MAGEDVALGDGTKRGVAALLFLGGVYVALDTMSTLHSSPWTVRTFGSDPAKAATARSYMLRAIAVSSALAATSGYIAASAWPLVGVAVTNAGLYYVYDKAQREAAGGGATTVP